MTSAEKLKTTLLLQKCVKLKKMIVVTPKTGTENSNFDNFVNIIS